MLQFVRQLFSRAKPETDLSYGLLEQLGIDKLLAAANWNALETKAAQLPANDLTRLLDGLCLTHRYDQVLTPYLAAGSSELRALVKGAHDVFLAWESRGALVASATSQEQVDGFYHYLGQALEHLNQPFENPAFQAEAAARLVRVGMGLGESELFQEAFELCRELAPTHLMGHFNYLRAVSPWWHGSVADLTAFVDAIADPELHRLFQLIYLNELHSFFSHELGSDAKATAQLLHDYRPRIDAVLAGPAAEGTSLAAVYYNNYLAGLHHLVGNTPARNQLIRAQGPHLTPYPWSYFGLTTAHSVQQLAKN
ncbi:MAG: hypothetical protein ACRYFZ_01250 [Janthinobacterium lividum]